MNSTLKIGLRVVLLGIVLVFIVRYAAGLDLAQVRALQPDWLLLVVAVGLLLSHRFLLVLDWIVLLRRFGVQGGRYRDFNCAFAKAWLGRYVPGKVALLMGRIYFARELGASTGAAAVAAVTNTAINLWVLSATALLGTSTALGQFTDASGYFSSALVIVVLGTVAFVPAVFNRVVTALFRLRKIGEASPPTLDGKSIALAVTIGVLVQLYYGVGVVCLAGAFAPELVEVPLFVLGTFSLSGLAGIVSVLAPAGLGVREAVQLPMLTLFAPPEAVFALVLTARVVDFAIDLAFVGMSVALRRS